MIDERFGIRFGAKPGRIAALAAKAARTGKRPRLAKASRRQRFSVADDPAQQ
jgi:hypothetical protein